MCSAQDHWQERAIFALIFFSLVLEKERHHIMYYIFVKTFLCDQYQYIYYQHLAELVPLD